jgi:hypothetical protein|tara:strand:- start:177 stop:374 length:198 start_codon:yes stop_codon:yes gene_type:complete
MRNIQLTSFNIVDCQDIHQDILWSFTTLALAMAFLKTLRGDYTIEELPVSDREFFEIHVSNKISK